MILPLHLISDTVAAVTAKPLSFIRRNENQNNLETRNNRPKHLFCSWEGCLSCDIGLKFALGNLYDQY